MWIMSLRIHMRSSRKVLVFTDSTWTEEKASFVCGCKGLCLQGLPDKPDFGMTCPLWNPSPDLWDHTNRLPEIFNIAGIHGIAVFLTFCCCLLICVNSTACLTPEQFLYHVNRLQRKNQKVAIKGNENCLNVPNSLYGSGQKHDILNVGNGNLEAVMYGSP